MALTQEDVAVIGQVIEKQITARIDQREATMRAEINQAFTQTGEAFEARLQQVIEQERNLFFEALRQIMDQVQGLAQMVMPNVVENPPVENTVVDAGDVDDDAFGNTFSTPAPAPPTKGIVGTPIGGATFGGE